MCRAALALFPRQLPQDDSDEGDVVAQCSEVRLLSGRSYTVPVMERHSLNRYHHEVRVALGVPRTHDVALVCVETRPPTLLPRSSVCRAEEHVSGRTFQAAIYSPFNRDDDEWLERMALRVAAVAAVKQSADYINARAQMPPTFDATDRAMPPTPDATDRTISQRRWVREVRLWRAELRRVVAPPV